METGSIEDLNDSRYNNLPPFSLLPRKTTTISRVEGMPSAWSYTWTSCIHNSVSCLNRLVLGGFRDEICEGTTYRFWAVIF